MGMLTLEFLSIIGILTFAFFLISHGSVNIRIFLSYLTEILKRETDMKHMFLS